MKCKNCLGIDNCNQDNEGHVWKQGKLIRCEYVFRGGSNTDLIKNDKFMIFSCDNKKELTDQIDKTRQAYIHSKCGIGKTHFLYYVANKFNLQGRHIQIDLFADTVRKIKESFNGNNKFMIGALATVDMLFIDDLGNEYATEYTVSEILQPIIDYRYLYNMPTIITSNYTVDELFAIYEKVAGGQRAAQIITRIKTLGAIQMQGKSRR